MMKLSCLKLFRKAKRVNRQSLLQFTRNKNNWFLLIHNLQLARLKNNFVQKLGFLFSSKQLFLRGRPWKMMTHVKRKISQRMLNYNCVCNLQEDVLGEILSWPFLIKLQCLFDNWKKEIKFYLSINVTIVGKKMKSEASTPLLWCPKPR